MQDYNGWDSMVPWAASGGAGLLGRTMYIAKQIQQGRRKPLTWALLLDVPIALATGWMALGLAAWLNIPYEAKISLAIFSGYLGPYGIDTLFDLLVDRFSIKEESSG